jgi:hypothetical protein
LQILALPLVKLGLLKSPENYNTYIVNIKNTNVKIWVNVILTHSIVIIHCVHQQNKYSHHIFKHVDVALPSSKNTLPYCENELNSNT